MMDPDPSNLYIDRGGSGSGSQTLVYCTFFFIIMPLVVSGGVMKTLSGVTLAPNSISLSNGSSLGGNTVTLAPTVSIAPGQSLLHSNIRVQPGKYFIYIVLFNLHKFRYPTSFLSLRFPIHLFFCFQDNLCC